MSDAARHDRVRELFHALFELPPKARAQRLDELDPPPDVRAEVEELLAEEPKFIFDEHVIDSIREKLVGEVSPPPIGPNRVDNPHHDGS